MSFNVLSVDVVASAFACNASFDGTSPFVALLVIAAFDCMLIPIFYTIFIPNAWSAGYLSGYKSYKEASVVYRGSYN